MEYIPEEYMIFEGQSTAVYRVPGKKDFIALKQCTLRGKDLFPFEVDALARMEHKNIVRFLRHRLHIGHSIEIEFEYCVGGTLARVLDKEHNTSLSWRYSTIYQLFDGLAHIHEIEYLHLDLEPTNILFRDSQRMIPVIADFGMATPAKASRTAGSGLFRAPEEIYTSASDVFSMAVIACCILMKKNTYCQRVTDNLIYHVLRDFTFKKLWPKLTSAVDSKPGRRPKAAKLRDVFVLSDSPTDEDEPINRENAKVHFRDPVIQGYCEVPSDDPTRKMGSQVRNNSDDWSSDLSTALIVGGFFVLKSLLFFG